MLSAREAFSSLIGMKFNLVKCICLWFVLSLASAQVWDAFFWPEEEEEEGDDEFWLDEEYENSTSYLKLVTLRSSDLWDEKELLEESSEIIIDEVSDSLDDDVIETHTSSLNEIISEHTIQLFNVLQLIRSHEAEETITWKFNFNDIFVWSNESDDKIKEILEEYYES